jgi:hypothetical protein
MVWISGLGFPGCFNTGIDTTPHPRHHFNRAFAGQKDSGVVHVLDADTGKETASGKTESPIRNLVVVKGICFTRSTNRQVFAIDAKGAVTKTDAQGTFFAADPKGDFVYTCVKVDINTDVYKYAVKGTKFTGEKEFFRSRQIISNRPGLQVTRDGLMNVQGLQVTAAGKAFGVVAGGGWADQENMRRDGVPLYSTEDMKSQLGELATGPCPSGFLSHPDESLLFACTGTEGQLFKAKAYTSIQKFAAPKEEPGPPHRPSSPSSRKGRSWRGATTRAIPGC